MERLIETLKVRFESHMYRHPNTSWKMIEPLLTDEVLVSLQAIEASGGEIDVVEDLPNVGLAFVDMAKESPKARVGACYDEKARLERKKNAPNTSVEKLVEDMQVNVLDEDQYRYLQSVEDLDCKTSSWLKTPDAIRELGGALFGDKRYNHVFVYHNSADSYYSSRGFRTYKPLT
ncbi:MULTISPECIES: DUF4256 domain-containing protein [unclassified Breznakia]|uniref:DUF4256 domain-containing protein n=1 Tax=unclassified Breznakia TaxID=2623764 RepID=UPI00247662CB|nr:MULTISPECIES: DUF4256 domain-containing protein [unclassified Breznakia]MDH6367290.1 hypothetical protein [Breznakia sp. PH1-1]MDH6404469.1 hypothetical protein [Breznakia sp. PF1-11]MDH6412140.1 hypothetical protein [Breznakia sp. PFB1-11]MDH6414457.1 hypothetical protein [Breznakia sp. PFB1-14]MDH6416842.1 hypothetical protein [Breznakia sp. PFB1-4]